MLAALDHTDELLLVCNPEVTSLKNVRIGLETIDRLGFERERVSLVANRIGAPGAVDRKEIESALDTGSRTSCRTIRRFRGGQPGNAGRHLERELAFLTRTLRLTARSSLRRRRLRTSSAAAPLLLRGRR